MGSRMLISTGISLVMACLTKPLMASVAEEFDDVVVLLVSVVVLLVSVVVLLVSALEVSLEEAVSFDDVDCDVELVSTSVDVSNRAGAGDGDGASFDRTLDTISTTSE